MHLFGVLHLAPGEWQSPNVRAGEFERRVSIYVRNAGNLSRSLRNRGIDFSLLTNDGDAVRAAAKRAGLLGDLEVLQTDFTLRVPSGLAFFSAHFKLEAHRHLGALSSPGWVGLVDLDMVAVGAVPSALTEMERLGQGLFYDISDQVIPAYGREVILADMQSLDAAVVEGRWCGGEFLCGPPALFRELSREVDALFPVYSRVAGRLHSVGDEIVTSVALECLRRRGVPLADAGTLGWVGRYWSGIPRHPQKPFRYFEDCFLLHLPADKELLAGLSPVECTNKEAFLRHYRRYLLRRAPRKVARWLLNTLAAARGAGS